MPAKMVFPPGSSIGIPQNRKSLCEALLGPRQVSEPCYLVKRCPSLPEGKGAKGSSPS